MTTTIPLGRRWSLPPWGTVLAAALLAELVTFCSLNRHFFGGGSGLLSQFDVFIPTGMLALGLALVILTGNIDLSAGAMASLSSVLVGILLNDHVNAVLAVLAAIAVTTFIGLVNGAFITLLGIDSLLVTLATQFIAGTVAVSLAGNNPPYNFAQGFVNLGEGSVGPVPVPLILFAVLAVVVAVAVGRTVVGRNLVLIGYSASASRYSGISRTRTLLAVFVANGVIAGIAGVVLAAYYDAGRPDSGIDLLLPAVTCVVLGGVDIFGGKGRIGEVVLAVLLIGYLTQGLLDQGVSSLTITMLTGGLLIVALAVKILLDRQSGESLGGTVRRLAGPRLARLGRATGRDGSRAGQVPEPLPAAQDDAGHR